MRAATYDALVEACRLFTTAAHDARDALNGQGIACPGSIALAAEKARAALAIVDEEIAPPPNRPAWADIEREALHSPIRASGRIAAARWPGNNRASADRNGRRAVSGQPQPTSHRELVEIAARQPRIYSFPEGDDWSKRHK